MSDCNLALDHRHIRLYALRLFGQQTVYRVETREDEERGHFVDVLYYLVEEVVVQDEAHATAVGTEPARPRLLVVGYDDDVVGVDGVLHCVDGVACLALQAHGQQEALHAGCLLR